MSPHSPDPGGRFGDEDAVGCRPDFNVTLARFWRCVRCDTIIRLTGDDSPPRADLPGPLWFAVAPRERVAFFEAHRTHLIELLTQTTPHVAATGPLADPTTVLRWEVSNGSRHFVIEGSRTLRATSPAAPTLDHTLSYRCLPGRLRVAGVHLGVPVEEISRAIDEAVFPHVLPLSRLHTLTDAATRAIMELRAEGFEVLSELPTDPATSVARIPTDDLERVIESVCRFMNARERERLAAKLRALHSSDNLLCTLTRCYELDLES